jgi:eukaryotic-like serine/threonine-protein kinase
VDSLDTLVHTRSLSQALSQGKDPKKRLNNDGPCEQDGLLRGRYRLAERLGAGGFGVVWQAHDELLDREVAVKRIPLLGTNHERATREALAAARLSHPAIVALYEAWAEQEAFYLVSELVHGETLAALIRDDSLSDTEVLDIGIALSQALAHAHARGVIHRDVKPQNVLVCATEGLPDGHTQREVVAKLTDFGGARLTGEDALTRTGDVLGTLAYMAPEQSVGQEAHEEADLYALALVLYEALSGTNPVRGATPAATARRLGRPLPALERHRGDLPRTLTRALDAALNPRPDRRGTLADLQSDLEQALKDGLEHRSARHRRSARKSSAPTIRVAADRRLPLITATAPFRRRGSTDPVPGAVATPQQNERDLLKAQSQEDTLAAVSVPTRVASAVAGGALIAGAFAWLGPSAPFPAGVAGAIACLALFAFPGLGCLTSVLSVLVWQIAAGRPGTALLLAGGVAVLVCLQRPARFAWPVASLPALLGLIGLAGAFPAIAGQASSWRTRAALGALGYWWLTLAEPLLGRRLWLGPLTGSGGHLVRASWQGSVNTVGSQVIAPLLSLAVLLGVAIWMVGCMVLPWIVRGHSAGLDALRATLWAAALAGSEPLLDQGVFARAQGANPRGVIGGAVLCAALAIGTRALRGPV